VGLGLLELNDSPLENISKVVVDQRLDEKISWPK
jgi:hypothetical protein